MDKTKVYFLRAATLAVGWGDKAGSLLSEMTGGLAKGGADPPGSAPSRTGKAQAGAAKSQSGGGAKFFEELATAKAAAKTAKAGVSRDAVSRFGALGKGGGRPPAGFNVESSPEEDAAYSGSGKMRGRSYKKADMGSTTTEGLQGLLAKGQTVEEVFKSLDLDNSRYLDQTELVEGMASLGTGLFNVCKYPTRQWPLARNRHVLTCMDPCVCGITSAGGHRH